MAQKARTLKTTTNQNKNILIGIVMCVLITVAGAMISAVMISKEIISEENMVYCTITILLVSSVIGCNTATINNKGKIYIRLMVAGIYACILLAMTALFFGGEYHGIVVTILVVITGALISILFTAKQGKTAKTHKSKKRRC